MTPLSRSPCSRAPVSGSPSRPSRGGSLFAAPLALLLAPLAGLGGDEKGGVAQASIYALLSPGALVAQEVRAGGGWAHPGIQDLRSVWGTGYGVRWIHRGIGLGLEYDRMAGSHRTAACLPPAEGGDGECVSDVFRIDTELDLVTLLAILEPVRTDDWRLRLAVGRTAGRATGDGLGLQTGTEVQVPPADLENSLLAWSRGADGTVLAFELLRRAPLPLPVHLRAAYRGHTLEMDGCEVGGVFPYCGRASVNELQLGLLAEWPWGWWRRDEDPD